MMRSKLFALRGTNMSQSDGLMTGKVCLITGATSGIGEVTARELARMGCRVLITARDQRKAEIAVDKLRAESGSLKIDGLVADLSSQDQVRDLAAEFMRQNNRLDVLINNAGAIYLRRYLSQDEIEMTFAVNHLAPFLLTNLLLEMVIDSTPARIINVASNSHKDQEIDFDDLESQASYGFMRAYGKSKLANIMFTYELDRRLAGSDVTVNAVHPGFVGTNMGANNGWLVKLFLPLTSLWALSPEEGAETSVFLASSPEVEGVSGKYFYQKKAVPSSPSSLDKEKARQLWEVSTEMTGL
jgi:NAD(P)-dependent dehydrogenase (short-subunit alcohol dehydrogenase family)